ncbi:MAG TPA: hypothetical protein VF691_07395 [Cytophagaceae bacterium]|jgi:hypothetical protein
MDNYNSIWVIENTAVSHYLTKDTNSLPDRDKLNDENPFDFILSTIDNLRSNLPHLFVILITEDVRKSISLIKQIKSITPHYKVEIKVLSSAISAEDTLYLKNNLNVNDVTHDVAVHKEIVDLITTVKRKVQ